MALGSQIHWLASIYGNVQWNILLFTGEFLCDTFDCITFDWF